MSRRYWRRPTGASTGASHVDVREVVTEVMSCFGQRDNVSGDSRKTLPAAQHSAFYYLDLGSWTARWIVSSRAHGGMPRARRTGSSPQPAAIIDSQA